MAYGSYLLAGLTPNTPRRHRMVTTIRNAGLGLSMMSIMTAGVSALPGSSLLRAADEQRHGNARPRVSRSRCSAASTSPKAPNS